MSIFEIIDNLERELESAKRTMFSNKSMVDATKCLDSLDDLRDMLPAELERAANIVKERRQILQDAENEAQQYLDAAQKRADILVSEEEVKKRAEAEARELLESAKQNAKEIRLGAKAYANELLEELERYLGRFAEQVKKSRDQFEA